MSNNAFRHFCCLKGVIHNFFREVLSDRFLLDLGFVAGGLEPQNLKEAVNDLNFFSLLLCSDVVLGFVVFEIYQGEEISKGVSVVDEVLEDVLF